MSTRFNRVLIALVAGLCVLLMAYVVAQGSARTSGWSPSETISGTEGSSYSPHLVADSQDTLHLVWHDWIDLVPHPPYIVYARRPAGGVWTTLETLPGKPMGDSPAAVVDSSDALHVVWTGLNNIGYACRSASGAWGDVEQIPASTDGMSPDVGVAPDGTVHAVWHMFAPDDERIYHSARSPGVGWSLPTLVYDGTSVRSPLLVVDTQGTAHLLVNSSGANVEALYVAKPSGGAWGVPIALPFSPLLESVEQLTGDAQGTLHLVWPERDGDTCSLYYVAKTLGQAWSQLAAIVYEPCSSVYVHRAAVASTDQGQPHVAWTSLLGEKSAWYAYAGPGSVWSAPSLVDDDLVGGDNRPTIAVDGAQGHHIAWDSGPTLVPYTGDGTGEIWTSRLEGSPPVTRVITPAGGTMQSGSGDVRLDFSPGSMDTDTSVTIGPATVSTTDGLVGLRLFDLSAEKVADGSPVTAFDPPYTLTVDYAASGHGTTVEATLGLYWWDGTQWQREASSSVDLANQRVSATPDHMTSFALLGETRRSYLPYVTR